MWEVMTGEAAQQSLLQASLCLPLSLSFSLSLSLPISCSALVLATNLLTDVNFYQRRLSMLPDTCPSERSQYTHTHTQAPIHTHTHVDRVRSADVEYLRGSLVALCF